MANSNAYRREWSWPDWLEGEIGEHLEHPCLHVCAGESKLGDLRLDAYTDCDFRADMFHLPFKDQSWLCILIDPPWGIQNHHRPALLWELRRVLAPGGLLILNSWWIPKVPGLRMERVAILRPRQFWTNVSAVAFYRRWPTIESFQEASP